MKCKTIQFKRKFLIKSIFILIIIMMLFLTISLIDYYYLDPSWLQTNLNKPVKNITGYIGAWLADLCFSIFGILSYIIPLILVLICWNLFKYFYYNYNFNFFKLSIRLIGILLLITSSCSFITLYINDLINFPSGGIIGSITIKYILLKFNISKILFSSIIILIWIISINLFTGLSWLKIIEKIGIVFFNTIFFLFRFIKNIFKIKSMFYLNI